jgi:hypothetical protein
MTRASDAPTGETIAKQLEGLTQQSNFADITNALTDAHAHRPGLFQQDLAAVNAKLHEQGILPDFNIVGVRGQDLVATDASGKTTLFDSTNLSYHHEDTTGSTAQINGRDATLNPDGSGKVTVKQGDTVWSISNDVLKAQGIENPTANQIANYVKELEHSNTISRRHPIRKGDQITLPPAVQNSANTEFTDDRANGEENKTVADINDTFAAAEAAIAKTKFYGIPFQGIDKARLQGFLDGNDLNDQERKGMQFLVNDYDQFQNKVTTRYGQPEVWFDESLVNKWQQTSLDQARLASFGQRKDD